MSEKATAGNPVAQKPAVNQNEGKAAIEAEASKAAAAKQIMPWSIVNPDDWAKQYWDKFSPSQHKGLSRDRMRARMAALAPYLSKHPTNESLKAHTRRLSNLIGK